MPSRYRIARGNLCLFCGLYFSNKCMDLNSFIIMELSRSAPRWIRTAQSVLLRPATRQSWPEAGPKPKTLTGNLRPAQKGSSILHSWQEIVSDVPITRSVPDSALKPSISQGQGRRVRKYRDLRKSTLSCHHMYGQQVDMIHCSAPARRQSITICRMYLSRHRTQI